MKKIYFLLLALLSTFAANAAIHTVFLEYSDKVGDNKFMVANPTTEGPGNANGTGIAFKELLAGYWVAATSTNLTSVAVCNGTSYNWKSKRMSLSYVSGDFAAIYMNSQNGEEIGGAYAVTPKLKGSWGGDNNVWTELDLTYKSGTTYRTEKQKFPSQSNASVNFGFIFYAGDAEKFYNGYNGQSLSSSNKTITWNKDGTTTNSSISLTANTEYYLEVDFSNMNISLVVETATPSLSLSLTQPSGNNLSTTSATIGYSFTASNFTSTPNVKVEYKKSGDSNYTTVGNYTATTRSSNITINGLTSNTTYTYNVKVSSGSYSDEKSVTFTTAFEPYYIYFDVTGWSGGDATPYCYVWYSSDDKKSNVWPGKEMTHVSGNLWSYQITSPDYNLVLFQSEPDKDKVGNFNLRPNHIYNYNGDTNKEYGADSSISAPTVTIEATDLKEEGSQYKYYICTITKNQDGVTTRYTTDGSEPTVMSPVYYNPFQVLPGTTVKARNFLDARYSAQMGEDTAPSQNLVFSWETAAAADRSHHFKVSLKDTPMDGATRLVNATFSQGSIDDQYQADYDASIFSWAKFADYEAFENMADDFVLNCSDHYPSDYDSEYEKIGWYNIQTNQNDFHVCRNFNNAYYRVYVHSNNESGKVNEPQGIRFRLPSAANDEETSTWYSVDGTTAGNVDPNATSRIAYTMLIAPTNDGTTGVEDILKDRDNGGEDAFDPEAPVEYYNLQGIRVVNPTHGIYIRVQGKKVSKEYVR